MEEGGVGTFVGAFPELVVMGGFCGGHSWLAEGGGGWMGDCERLLTLNQIQDFLRQGGVCYRPCWSFPKKFCQLAFVRPEKDVVCGIPLPADDAPSAMLDEKV